MKLFRKKQENRQLFPYISNYFSSGLFTAELNPAVDNAVSRIANTVSILPITLYSYTRSGKTEAFWNQGYRLLKDPAVEETAVLFYKTMIRHILLKGNAYIFKHKSKGEILSLELVDPNCVQIRRDHTGRKLYTIHGERSGTFTDSDIIHIPYTGEGYNGTKGMSPVEIHKDLVQKNEVIHEYVSLFFRNGIGSRLLVELGSDFQAGSPKMEKLMQEFKTYFNAFVLGPEHAGQPIVTPAGTKISKIEQSSNVQTDTLNLLAESNNEIYRMFNIPPEVISSRESKYNSLEQKNADYLISCIQPLCKHIAEMLIKGLEIDDPRMFIAYDYSGLQETDLSKKMDFYVKGYQSGVFSLNEVRAGLNLSSVENDAEGDTRWVPANLVPLTEDTINSYMAKSKQIMSEMEHSATGDNFI